ncbi:MAG: N-acetylglucosamine kinase [Synechococcus sp.]|nr:N-acetylglucosamine kinase [Synechococcus sp.]
MTLPSPSGGLLAGFDAGQTHTRCRLSQRDGRVIAEGEGSGVSHLGSEQGPERFRQALQSSLEAARRQGGTALEPLAAAAIGASGIEQDSPTQRLGTDLARQALGLDAVLVTGDERTALAGAFAPGQAGISLISGTGAIALGAMDIGRDGLAISLRMADGRLPVTGLKAALWQALGVQQAHELKALVVDPGFGAAGFARLAPVVHQQALAGDAHAQSVLQNAGDELAAMVIGVAEALELEAPALCCSGGAISHLNLLRHAMDRSLMDHLPGLHHVQPQGDACDGALRLAQTLSS